MVCASLLSLAIFGIFNHALEWGSSKCPWEAKKVKFIVFIVIAIVCVTFLISHHRHHSARKHLRHQKIEALFKASQGANASS